MNSSSESDEFLFLLFFLLGFEMEKLDYPWTIKESRSGMLIVPLLSALKDAFGLSTVCLNQPTSYPQIYWLSYSLFPLIFTFP